MVKYAQRIHTLYTLFLFLLPCLLFGQFIQVDGSLTKEELVEKFIGTTCIQIVESSVHIKGWTFDDNDKSYGYFTKSSSSFGIDEGILLSSGKLLDAPGPNFGINNADHKDWKGDTDLEKALHLNSGTTYNATILEFDFISPELNHISFDYLFASEQYLKKYDKGNCGYTDGFAFLIKEANTSETYRNLAVLPNTTTPVSVNTVFGNDGKCSPINPQYFGQFNPNMSPISFNGQTIVMKAETYIIPGKRYHIKLVIADQGNGLYDSGVFLKAGSFVGTKSLGDDIYLCQGETETIDATTPDATAYKWYKDGKEIIGEINAKLIVSETGFYEAEITLNSGCNLRGTIDVSKQADPVLDLNVSICDSKLNGIIEVTLADYTTQIVTNLEEDTHAFNVKYFETRQDAENNVNHITNTKLTTAQPSKTIYIRLEPGNCTPIIEKILFTTKDLSQANHVPPIDICDNDLSNNQEIILTDYIDDLVTNIYKSPTFYLTEADAKNQTSDIDATQTINSDQTFWVRFEQNNLCQNVAPLHFIFKQPKKSDQLKDITICKTATTTLDAGSGFDSYLWSNGSTESFIENVPVGKYTVRLESNGCFYTQEVNVFAFEEPIIQSIDIQGTTVTINVSGAVPPYSYSLDNGPFQSSNIFTNVTFGQHIISVKSATNCETVQQEFSLIKLINFISPNGDGKNDFLDYSQLKNKLNPKFLIYTRSGKLLFEGNTSNNFTWDGKLNGIVLPSDSYWYHIEWTEPTSGKVQLFESWLLLKNSY